MHKRSSLNILRQKQIWTHMCNDADLHNHTCMKECNINGYEQTEWASDTKKKHRWKQTNTSYMLHASIQCTCKNKCSMGFFLLEKTNIYTLSQSSFQSQTYHPPPCASPISQIHNWATIMPEFICMVPAEVFTRCLWVLLTWLGCRSANLLGWSSGYSSIICWIWEML